MAFIGIKGTKFVVVPNGEEIGLRGAGLGGWMLMENFISGVFYIPAVTSQYRTDRYAGFPGCEYQIRETLAEVIGEQKAQFFFDKVSVPFLLFG